MRGGRSHPRAVRSNRLFAGLPVRPNERDRTRANAEPCHACHGFRRRTGVTPVRKTTPKARSLQGGEREGDCLVWRELLALLPGLGKCTFVELSPDGAECLLVPLGRQWSRAAANLLVQSLRAGEHAGACCRSSREGEAAGEAVQVHRSLGWGH